MDRAGRRPRSNDSAVLIAYRLAIWLFALLVLVQAMLAGQFLNGQGELITLHRALGSQVLPGLSLVLVVMAVVLRGGAPWRILAVPTALLALTTLQTGLGFLGRSSLAAAGWHVPLGVAIFGLAIYQSAGAQRMQPRPVA